MKTKSLKVYEGSGKNYMPIPKILLQGKWLDKLGYSIGDQITVPAVRIRSRSQNPLSPRPAAEWKG